ncbi:MAG: hypothetical protein CM15mP127_01080 [Gammaproteobacteria bacterium]|nr:MAG: hypothetical protein CM15mP127_01080 [Gammaproteobacteria bacterium]
MVFLMHYQGDQQSNHDGIELTNSSWINPQEAWMLVQRQNEYDNSNN